MRIVIAPDSFKGCLNALNAALAMRRGVHRIYPDSVIDMIPMADGGEGTVEAILCAVRGEKIKIDVTDPLGRSIGAAYTLDEAFLQAKEQLERAVWRILTVWKLGEESAVKKMTKV